MPEEIDSLDVITAPDGELDDSSDILNIPVNQRKGQGNKYHQTAHDPKSVLLFGKLYGYDIDNIHNILFNVYIYTLQILLQHYVKHRLLSSS